MDLRSTSFLLSSLVLLLLLLKRNGFRRRVANAGGKLPPGPFNLPVIGSLHHLLGPLPHQTLAALAKKFGPVILLKLGEVPTLVVSSAEAAAEVMKTHDVSFATRPIILTVKIMSYNGKGIAFAPYGSYWRELRKMSTLELLSVKRVQSFRSIRQEEVLSFARSIEQLSGAGSLVNLSRKFILLTNDIGARVIIGSKCKYQKEFLRILNQGLEASGGFNLADLYPSSPLVALLTGMSLKLQRLHRDVDAILRSIIDEHRETKKKSGEQVEEDLIGVLLRVQEEGSLPFLLSDESIKAMVLDLFGAASETSATTMEWAMAELMRNPRVMKKVQEEVRGTVGGKGKVTEEDVNEMIYLRQVIKETMRLHPPLPLLLPRECQEPVDVLGYRIPAKTRVLVNVWALGRNPRYWDGAAEFRPERFDRGGSSAAVDFKGTNFEFLPFGAGRRMCPGISFGMASVELPLACLLYYFDWELPAAAAAPSELDMAENFVLTCRRKSELCLTAVPRMPIVPMT